MNPVIRFLVPALAGVALAACAALGGKPTPFSIHSLVVPAFDAPQAAPVDWQLQVLLPQASSALDSARIAVMPTPGVPESIRLCAGVTRAALLRSLVVQAFDARAASPASAARRPA